MAHTSEHLAVLGKLSDNTRAKKGGGEHQTCWNSSNARVDTQTKGPDRVVVTSHPSSWYLGAMRPWLQMMMMLLSSWPSGSAFIVVAYSIPSARRFTLPLTTSKDNNDTGFLIKIRDAKFSDLSEVARMISDGFFHDEGQNNPIMRWIRPIMELDRLQTSFTYEMEVDGGSVVDRHYFLVAHDGEDNKVVGFCDVDGRGGYGVAKASLLP